jgi:rod shape-determining protein MreD
VRPSRLTLFAALIVTALMLQVTVFNRLPLPVVAPNLFLVVVVSCALLSTPAGGATLGFLAGLLADLAPPADHTIGRAAAVYALVGYAAGRVEDVEERPVLAPIVLVALATVGAILADALIGALLGDARLHWLVVARHLPVAALYDVVLTPLIVPLVIRLTRRVGPEFVRR